MSLKVPDHLVQHSKLHTAHQRMAEKRQNYSLLIGALLAYPAPLVNQAMELLHTGTLARSERFLPMVTWLSGLHQRYSDALGNRNKANILWRAVALAPDGFNHVKTSVVGTLLDDIKAGLSFEAIRARFGEKLDPLQYQRPQAAPSEGNIDQAEKIIEATGLRPALARRLARLDDLQFLWVPETLQEAPAGTGGVFDHLRSTSNDNRRTIEVAPVRVTWAKFLRDILPGVSDMEFWVNLTDSFLAFVTAEDPEAPPIIAWDRAGVRNPVSWYVYNHGSPAHQWGLNAHSWAKVIGLSYLPFMWNGADFPGHEPGVVFLLEGAHDSQAKRAGLGLFPEILVSTLRPIRSTIEAFSQKGVLGGDIYSSVGGVVLDKANQWANARCRISKSGVVSQYQLDRWE